MQTSCHQIQLNPCDQNPQKELIYYPWTVLWTLWCSGHSCVINAAFACAYMSPHSVLSTWISTWMFGIHWARRCLCSSFACWQKFHKEWFFFQRDLEVLVSCDTQKCNYSCLELTDSGRSREWACSNWGEDFLSSHLCGLLCSTCKAASCDQLFQIP